MRNDKSSMTISMRSCSTAFAMLLGLAAVAGAEPAATLVRQDLIIGDTISGGFEGKPAASGREHHVATTGNDVHPGTPDQPFKTISAAAAIAQPGDTITVHAGVYRERVDPPRGGTSDTRRITYQAAPGEKVVITGSEVVKGWEKAGNDTWKVTLPNSFFGSFNPYSDVIRGDWFNPKERKHHTGAVYLNGDWLMEAARLEDVLQPAVSTALWFGQVDAAQTTLWAQFPGINPNEAKVEINVRQTVFTPTRTGVDHITLRGFALRHAATPWAPPTVGQIGLVTAYWCKGWIIEDNEISHSTCSGVSLGKYSDEWDNRSSNSAEGYVDTVKRALVRGWNRKTVGSHVVRRNHIHHCEQAGIVGSLGCSFSTVTGNVVHDIHVRQLFTGAEMAGIKFHGAIDTVINHNHIYRTNRGLWLDWMAQGARVSGNLFHDNDTDQDLYMEVNHGPYLVDNNIFLSRWNFWDMSEGGAFVHNLFAGKIVTQPDRGRHTPFHAAHSTEIAGITNITTRDNRFHQNIFVANGTDGAEGSTGNWRAKHLPRGAGYGLWVYDPQEAPLQTSGNVYYHGAKPYSNEVGPLVLAGRNPSVKLERTEGNFVLECDFGDEVKKVNTARITAALLGNVRIPDLPFENSDSTSLSIDRDYFGNERDAANPRPGPFEHMDGSHQKFKIPATGYTTDNRKLRKTTDE